MNEYEKTQAAPDVQKRIDEFQEYADGAHNRLSEIEGNVQRFYDRFFGSTPEGAGEDAKAQDCAGSADLLSVSLRDVNHRLESLVGLTSKLEHIA